MPSSAARDVRCGGGLRRRRYENEQRDRASLTLPNDQNQLIRAVSAVNPNTVVVLGARGPGADAVAAAGSMRSSTRYFGGQEQGNAIASVLFGDVNPSGKLPITFPRSESQPDAAGDPRTRGTRVDDLTVEYDEGVFVGYRGYDRAGLDPAVPVRARAVLHVSFAYRNLATSRQGGDVQVQFTAAQHRAAHGRRDGAGLRRATAHERAHAAQAARRLRQGHARSRRGANASP